MATPVAIPPEGTIYAKLLNAMNKKQYARVCWMYELLDPPEHHALKYSYPDIYAMLNEIYVSEKMATATLASNS